MSEKDNISDISSLVLLVVSAILLLNYVTNTNFFQEAIQIPENSGGWFFAYQNLVAGFFAIVGGFIAYCGVLKNISWQQQKKEEEIQKIMGDLIEDSRLATLVLLTISKMIQKDLVKQAFDFIKSQVPVELGYKFYDNESIEKLDSIQRIQVRDIAKNLEDFNKYIKEKKYKEASESVMFYKMSCEQLFGDHYTRMQDLSAAMVSAIKSKSN